MPPLLLHPALPQDRGPYQRACPSEFPMEARAAAVSLFKIPSASIGGPVSPQCSLAAVVTTHNYVIADTDR